MRHHRWTSSLATDGLELHLLAQTALKMFECCLAAFLESWQMLPTGKQHNKSHLCCTVKYWWLKHYHQSSPIQDTEYTVKVSLLLLVSVIQFTRGKLVNYTFVWDEHIIITVVMLIFFASSKENLHANIQPLKVSVSQLLPIRTQCLFSRIH